MIISMEVDQKTLEYQERLNIDIENISKNKTKNWRPMYEIIDTSFFAATKRFPPEFLDHCKNNRNEPQSLPSEVKVSLKKMLRKKGYMKKW